MAKPKSTQQERAEVLHRIWLAQAKKLADRLEGTPSSDLEASLLNVARQFLSDNGINADTLKHADPAASPVRSLAAEIGEIVTDLPDMSVNWPNHRIK